MNRVFFVLVVMCVGATVSADDNKPQPPWHPSPAPVIDIDEEIEVSSDLVAVVDAPRVSVSLGGGRSDFIQYTARCVAPAEGGFLKRGFNLLLIQVGPKVEIDADCVEHTEAIEREYAAAETARAAAERLLAEAAIVRAEVERLRLEQCFSCEVVK